MFTKEHLLWGLEWQKSTSGQLKFLRPSLIKELQQAWEGFPELRVSPLFPAPDKFTLNTLQWVLTF